MINFIKKSAILLITTFFYTQIVAEENSVQTINKIIAFVNKDIITMNEFETQILFYKFNNSDKKNINSNTKNNILDQLINYKLELNVANKEGINTNEEEIDTAIKSILKSQNLNIIQLKSKLSDYKINYNQYKQFIKEQIILEKLKQKNIDSRIFISEDEINRILNSEAFKSRIDYNLSYILISIPEDSTSNIYNQKKQMAVQALKSLKEGESFSSVSTKFSNTNNALHGNNIGWKSDVVLPPQIAKALSKIKKNEFTDIIELPIGFMIFKINDIRSFYTQQIMTQYHVNHILIKVNENRSNEEALKKINELYQQLESLTKNKTIFKKEFTKLAKKYSEDTSSINGGNIGWVSKSDTFPTFEQQIISLPIYTLSKPVRTPFGWHIIYVDDINTTNKTSDIEKNAIRQEIRELKITLLYAEWIRNLRDSAYVVKVANN
jgi:peptidyl-prolyl cis-trans isomerase SurA